MNVKVLEKLNHHNDADKENQIIQSLDEIVQDGIHQLRETVYQQSTGAIYVTPSHQFPLGGILPASRRAA
ncbi:hypothetical protein DOT_1959 [Desulfosporosinus sp. OT]|nr:hypothetical protein DOT_1959 [Desulfosporosinus sp. OT]